MNERETEQSRRIALLDTTIQLDRVKSKWRARPIEQYLKDFDERVATSIVLLEFKATIIQECIHIHNLLRRDDRFSAVQDSVIEKKHRQVSLRAHILHNLLNIHASSFATPEDQDRLLGRKARQLLENIIPRLYDWFVQSVDAVLRDRIRCTRAAERPMKKQVAFETNLPVCRRGRNKSCCIESFIREHGSEFGALRQRLSEMDEERRPRQLVQACAVFEAVEQDLNHDLSNGDCRRAGDCLIALEAKGHATHALSTNATEWNTLSELLGFEFVKIEYPREQI